MDNIFKLFGRFSLILLILISLNSMAGDIIFRLKYSFPKVSEFTDDKISTYNEPVQKNITETKYIKAKGEKNLYVLKAEAEYSISGLVVATNSNFWFRDIMRNNFDDVALLDVGLVWGDLARDKKLLYNNVKFKSKKTLGQARQLQPKCKRALCNDFPWEWDYFNTHDSHNHLIPANRNVMGALLKIKKDDIIKLDGYLVDIYTDKTELVAMTSLSRTDNNATARGVNRGGGACEVMYVTQVQIGNKIYR
ncbi:hypothetical protein J6P92_07425 [bacterium]|nr:hypothetical protein [bacterium]